MPTAEPSGADIRLPYIACDRRCRSYTPDNATSHPINQDCFTATATPFDPCYAPLKRVVNRDVNECCPRGIVDYSLYMSVFYGYWSYLKVV